MSSPTVKRVFVEFGAAVRTGSDGMRDRMVELTRVLNESTERARAQVERSRRRP